MTTDCVFDVSIHAFSVGEVQYRGLFKPHGDPQASAPERRPVLLLGGTSISMADQKELIDCLFTAGFDIAAIETPMGGLWHAGGVPKKVRRDALVDFIKHLCATEKIKGIDIVAHSYAAFEVVRTLMAASVTYRPLIKSVVLINPPGFSARLTFVSHLLRIIWGHILCGYLKMLWCRYGWGHCTGMVTNAARKAFARREMRGIVAMTFKGMQNPVRTIREIRDIVSFKPAGPISQLQEIHGYDFNLFLNAGDRMVQVQDTLFCGLRLLPPENIRVVPGGHNDIVFQQWQRQALIAFLNEIRARTS
jgi:hypothetical protein